MLSWALNIDIFNIQNLELLLCVCPSITIKLSIFIYVSYHNIGSNIYDIYFSGTD